jgi:hypothetical protein
MIPNFREFAINFAVGLGLLLALCLVIRAIVAWRSASQ